jgi:tetratricopeptide (TPR) repeat protein
MDDCADLEKILATAKKTLTEMEVQAAVYAASTIPVHTKQDLEKKREEVEDLKARLKKAQLEHEKVQPNALESLNRMSPRRLRVSDEYYIERDAAQKLLKHFESALLEPEKSPLLFNICGIGGVGKTTLLGRLQEDHIGEVDFLEVCFAKTADIETPLKLMRKLHQQARDLFGIETSTDIFAQREQQFTTTLFELSQQSVDNSRTNREDERKITSWFERLIWLGTASFTSTSSKPKPDEVSGLGFTALGASGEDTESLKEWIHQLVRNHPATKDSPELQALMLQPVAQLTQAFAQSLMQIAQRKERAIVLILDTYEKAQTYLNQWLWQYLVEDTSLASAPVRLIVVGRRSLQADEGWRKLNQDRKLLHETQLQRFDKKDTEEYLKQIGIQNGRTRATIFKATQGLPYYLDWVRKQQEEGKELDFSQGNQAISKLLLQGIDSQQQKIVELVACCRWFDLSMIRHLLKCDGLDLQPDLDVARAGDYFEWLKQSDFVEFTKGHYRLDDVARDVFRQSCFQKDQTRFRRINAILAAYFQQQADELIDPQSPLPDSYEEEDWRRLIIEFLYYSLFGKGKTGLHEYIEQVFIATYLREPDVFVTPAAFIKSEINEKNKNLLPTATSKFFNDAEIALRFGWLFVNKSPGSYKIKFEGDGDLSKDNIESRLRKIDDSLQALLEYTEELQDGFGKCLGLISKSLRCNRLKEKTDSLLQAKNQAEQLLTNCRPKLLHHIFFKIGNLLFSIPRYQDTLICYDKVLELDPNSVDAWKNRGVVLGNLERHDEALASFQKVLELDPSSADAWINRGQALGNLECHDEALASFQKVLELDPNFVDAWINRGQALGNLERHDEALASFQKVLELDPNSADAWINRGNTLGNLGRYDEALIDFNRAVEIDPQNDNVFNSQSLTLSILKDFDRAMIAINKAISLNPEEVLLRANRGIILARAGQYSEALNICEQAIQEDPKHECGYYANACYYALQGTIDLAIDNLKQAISIAPRRCRLEAKHNPDFNEIRNDERFQVLVYPESKN